MVDTYISVKVELRELDVGGLDSGLCNYDLNVKARVESAKRVLVTTCVVSSEMSASVLQTGK
jgi:hypothetical protein